MNAKIVYPSNIITIISLILLLSQFTLRTTSLAIISNEVSMNNTDDSDDIDQDRYTTVLNQYRHRIIQEEEDVVVVPDHPIQQQLRLLVVRIIDSMGIEPNETIQDIEETIFGNTNNITSTNNNNSSNNNITSVVQQLASITHGQVQLVPLQQQQQQSSSLVSSISSSSSSIINVPISIHITNETEFFIDLVPIMINTTQSILLQQSQLYEQGLPDITIFCIPNGSSLGGNTRWKAVAVKNEPYAYFQNSYCTYISPVIHELGHAIFGYYHSSKDREEYGDTSCYMGLIDIDTPRGRPLKAFNAHKHWVSGWFHNRTIVVNMTSSSTTTISDPFVWGKEYRLISFVDYSNYDNNELYETDVVLIVVADLYIQYDIAKGYNIDSLAADTGSVMVTQANDTMSFSFAVANLTSGEFYRYQTTSMNDGSSIVIEVCSTGNVIGTLDYSTIRIYLNNDGENRTSQCNNTITVSPTATPLSNISDAPSTFISSIPSTIIMSSYPTAVPSTHMNVSSQSPTTSATSNISQSPLTTSQPQPRTMPTTMVEPSSIPQSASSGSIVKYNCFHSVLYNNCCSRILTTNIINIAILYMIELLVRV